MNNYPVGDFLIRVKNAGLARKRQVEVPKNKVIKEVAKALKRLRYLDEIGEKEGKLVVKLSYRKKEPLLTDLKLVSKPGLRVYQGADELAKKRGLSTYIVSTPKGILSLKEALKKRVGGEVIAEVS